MPRSAANKKRIPFKLVKKVELQPKPLPNLSLLNDVFDNELILKTILSYLNAKQLKAVCRVSKKWKKISDVLSTRKLKIDDFFFVYNTSRLNEFDIIIEYISLIESSDCLDKFREKLIDFTKKELETIPKLCVLMGGNQGLDWNDFNNLIDNKVFMQNFPRNCQIINVTSHNGVIGRMKDKNISVETMNYFGNIEAISGLIFPDYSDKCKIIPFYDDCYLKKYIHNNLWKEHKLKSILIFFKENDYIFESENLNLKELVNLSENEISLGGALIDHIKVSKNILELKDENEEFFIDVNLTGLIFCGDNVNSASIILKDKKIKSLNKKLTQFKNNLTFDVNNKNCELIGFLFSCCSRSINIFHKLNVESNLITNLFPNIKLYGIFGNGEIGNNSSKNPKFRDKKINRIDFKVYLNYFSSVFVIISISKKNI